MRDPYLSGISTSISGYREVKSASGATPAGRAGSRSKIANDVNVYAVIKNPNDRHRPPLSLSFPPSLHSESVRVISLFAAVFTAVEKSGHALASSFHFFFLSFFPPVR